MTPFGISGMPVSQPLRTSTPQFSFNDIQILERLKKLEEDVANLGNTLLCYYAKMDGLEKSQRILEVSCINVYDNLRNVDNRLEKVEKMLGLSPIWVLPNEKNGMAEE
jgi:hypothetical protein